MLRIWFLQNVCFGPVLYCLLSHLYGVQYIQGYLISHLELISLSVYTCGRFKGRLISMGVHLSRHYDFKGRVISVWMSVDVLGLELYQCTSWLTLEAKVISVCMRVCL